MKERLGNQLLKTNLEYVAEIVGFQVCEKG
jgi:hypothetical protein